MVNEGNLLYKLLLLPPLLLHPNICYVERQRRGNASAATSANAATAAGAARMVLIGGWSGDERAGGRADDGGGRPTDRLAGRRAVQLAARAVAGVVIMIHNSDRVWWKTKVTRNVMVAAHVSWISVTNMDFLCK